MPTYALQLELYVEADSPEDAALEGEAQLDDPARQPFVWGVKLSDDSEWTGAAWQEIDAESLL